MCCHVLISPRKNICKIQPDKKAYFLSQRKLIDHFHPDIREKDSKLFVKFSENRQNKRIITNDAKFLFDLFLKLWVFYMSLS